MPTTHLHRATRDDCCRMNRQRPQPCPHQTSSARLATARLGSAQRRATCGAPVVQGPSPPRGAKLRRALVGGLLTDEEISLQAQSLFPLLNTPARLAFDRSGAMTTPLSNN